MTLINHVTRIHFADGVLEDALRAEIEAARIRRPLIVADRGAVEDNLIDRLFLALPRGIAATLFDAVPAPPTEAAARAAAALYLEAGCDALVSFGSGAAIDLAKAAGLAVRHEGPFSRYAAAEGGAGRIRGPLPAHLAIPTTAGSGAEVDPAALVLLADAGQAGLCSPRLVPDTAICDPTLTLSLPPGPSAATGMDALSHLVETHVATGYNPPADGIALDGLARLSASIERVVQNGADLAARREMMAAAMNGALAMQKGLGAVHAASHALGVLCARADHGSLNAVLLPHVLAFDEPAAAHRYPAILRALGRGTDLPEALSRLTERLGLPGRLSALGVGATALETAPCLAERDRANGTNPRRAAAGDYRALMRAAL